MKQHTKFSEEELKRILTKKALIDKLKFEVVERRDRHGKCYLSPELVVVETGKDEKEKLSNTLKFYYALIQSPELKKEIGIFSVTGDRRFNVDEKVYMRWKERIEKELLENLNEVVGEIESSPVLEKVGEIRKADVEISPLTPLDANKRRKTSPALPTDESVDSRWIEIKQNPLLLYKAIFNSLTPFEKVEKNTVKINDDSFAKEIYEFLKDKRLKNGFFSKKSIGISSYAGPGKKNEGGFCLTINNLEIYKKWYEELKQRIIQFALAQDIATSGITSPYEMIRLTQNLSGDQIPELQNPESFSIPQSPEMNPKETQLSPQEIVELLQSADSFTNAEINPELTDEQVADQEISTQEPNVDRYINLDFENSGAEQTQSPKPLVQDPTPLIQHSVFSFAEKKEFDLPSDNNLPQPLLMAESKLSMWENAEFIQKSIILYNHISPNRTMTEIQICGEFADVISNLMRTNSDFYQKRAGIEEYKGETNGFYFFKVNPILFSLWVQDLQTTISNFIKTQAQDNSRFCKK